MEKHRKLFEGLREKGLRLTPQREMILSAISKGAGHFSAEALMAVVRKQYPYLNKSVIYRNLERLTELGILNQADFGKGYLEYELHDHPHHHHLVCQNCGKIIEIDEAMLLSFYQKLQLEYDFEPSINHQAIKGLCGDCRTEKKS